MGIDKKWCPSRLDSWPFVFFYINDFPEIINKDTDMVPFADFTSILVTDSNKLDCNRNINQTFLGINTWFKDNLLSLNFNKTQYLEFGTKHYYKVNTEMKYDQKYITKATKIKFEINYRRYIILDTTHRSGSM
jgi:hypothetical protein